MNPPEEEGGGGLALFNNIILNRREMGWGGGFGRQGAGLFGIR
jgi:hypothetical protein